MNSRDEFLNQIAQKILLASSPSKRYLVAIDGVDGSGKTFFANELSEKIIKHGRKVIRASVDGFHNSREIRYAKGRSSPEGFFEDSYNYADLKNSLLEPLAPSGNGLYYRAKFDHTKNKEVVFPKEQAGSDDILIFDGIFLHRKELIEYWDFSIFLNVDFPISIERCGLRDNCSVDYRAESNKRYVEGQKIYLSECRPKQKANLVINNEELDQPFIETEN